MPLPRYKQVNVDVTPYYHCTTRCVRQSYLCGCDNETGRNFEHRRKWIKDRLHLLSSSFSIELCAYAVMHNHTHVVLFVNRERVKDWSVREVFNRWRNFYKCPPLVQRYLDDIDDQAFSEAEEKILLEYAEEYRRRLCSVSWFMRLLNEYIARKANKEDDCKGYFWERRFRSQALLNEKALIAAMAYTDLNPVRANLAPTPEESDFTSVKYRINARRARKSPLFLKPFSGCIDKRGRSALPITLDSYLSLVDETGRYVRNDKKGTISSSLQPILDRLELEAPAWLTISCQLEDTFSGPIGTPIAIVDFAEQCQYGRTPNVTNATRYLM